MAMFVREANCLVKAGLSQAREWEMLGKVSVPEDRTAAGVVSLHELTRRNFTDPHL